MEGSGMRASLYNDIARGNHSDSFALIRDTFFSFPPAKKSRETRIIREMQVDFNTVSRISRWTIKRGRRPRRGFFFFFFFNDQLNELVRPRARSGLRSVYNSRFPSRAYWSWGIPVWRLMFNLTATRAARDARLRDDTRFSIQDFISKTHFEKRDLVTREYLWSYRNLPVVDGFYHNSGIVIKRREGL